MMNTGFIYIGQKMGIGKVKNVSKEFKKLFYKKVSFCPSERLSIKDILYGNWMNNI